MSYRTLSTRSTKFGRSTKIGNLVSNVMSKRSDSVSSMVSDDGFSTKSNAVSVKAVKVIDDPIEEHTVKVQLPTYDVIDVPYYRSKTYAPSVTDLKNKISELSKGMDPRRIRIVYKLKEYKDNEDLSFIDTIPNCVLQVVYRMVNVDDEQTQMEYSGFIRSFSPTEGCVTVPVTDPIRIHLAPNGFGHVIRIAALLDHSMLPLRHSGDMLAQLKGDIAQAKERGFCQWTDQTHMERILLLEVDDHLDLRLESIRYYTYGVNAGYCGGDHHSWQRYTRNYPVECRITVTDVHEDEGGGEEHHLITLQPYAPLKYSTSYALLLGNNVPTVPVGSITAPWTAFAMGGVNEDKLFIFRTERKPS